MATNYGVNYDDKRFADVEADKNAALNEVEQKYGDMIGGVDDKYNALIDESQKWAEQQTQLQKEQTAFTIEKIEEQKARAEKDYQKEQSGAYVDWQKQSNQYGANAEAMAAQGLTGTGYSESSQVSMYTTYQNRVATAREAFVRATTDYDMAIKDAQLQNSSILAEIAHNAQQRRLELILEGFQYKNNLIIDQMNKKQEVDNTYYARYQDVLNQINTENALAEQVRQYNQDYELRMKQYEEEIRQYNQDYDLRMKQYEEGIRQFNEEIARLKAQDEKENALKIQQLELQRRQLEEEQRRILDEKTPVSIHEIYTGKKFTGKTLKEAVDYLKSKGVPNEYASTILSSGEWARKKASSKATGVGTAAVFDHDTYESYLKYTIDDYVAKYGKNK